MSLGIHRRKRDCDRARRRFGLLEGEETLATESIPKGVSKISQPPMFDHRKVQNKRGRPNLFDEGKLAGSGYRQGLDTAPSQGTLTSASGRTLADRLSARMLDTP